MSHYASVLPESVTYADDSSQEQPLTQSAQSAQSTQSECLSYKSDGCSKSCLCSSVNEAAPDNSVTVENEGGEKIILMSYSKDGENRIVINQVDMSFNEFKGYLGDIGMVDDYEIIEEKHLNELKNVSTCSALVASLAVMGLISWFSLLLRGNVLIGL